MKVLTSKEDDFLYEYVLDFLEQIKLVQGGTALSATLRRHSLLKEYMIQKQRDKIAYIEETYFDMEHNSLNDDAITAYHNRSLQNN